MVKPLPPPEVTEKWPPLNYINPETRPWELLLGITIFMMGLTIIIVLLRTYVRFILLHAPGWDDYFIWIATVRHPELKVVELANAIGIRSVQLDSV